MSSCCSGFCSSAARQFDAGVAEADLDRYRRKGANGTTRAIRDLVQRAGGGQTLLDIGAGIGALSFELLSSGFVRATLVDASPAYLAVATRETERRGDEHRLTLHAGDFVAVSGALPPADAVVLDRVVCCYPAFEPLLREALGHSRRLFAMSYPHDRWYVRAVIAFENALRSLRGNEFRAFVHPAAAMAALVASQGFERVGRDRSMIWCVDLFVRRS